MDSLPPSLSSAWLGFGVLFLQQNAAMGGGEQSATAVNVSSSSTPPITSPLACTLPASVSSTTKHKPRRTMSTALRGEVRQFVSAS